MKQDGTAIVIQNCIFFLILVWILSNIDTKLTRIEAQLSRIPVYRPCTMAELADRIATLPSTGGTIDAGKCYVGWKLEQPK